MPPHLHRLLLTTKIKNMKKHGREWEELSKYSPSAEDWRVCHIEGIGEMWMNNTDGYIVLYEGERTYISYI